MQWVRFFVGTPPRFLATTGALAVMFFLARPDILERAITGLLTAIVNAIEPFVGPLLTLAIIIAVIGWLVRSAIPKKKSGGK